MVKLTRSIDEQNFNLCVGVQIMLAILLLLILAVNGGLFVGTVMFSAYKSVKMDEAISFANQILGKSLSA
jgi:hypothetical protein